ncbi:hypothetical protein ACOI99_11405, partial [Corynebacterium striatum]
ATPADRGAANINYERKPLAVPGTWNPGTNYADSRYQLPQIDTQRFFPIQLWAEKCLVYPRWALSTSGPIDYPS